MNLSLLEEIEDWKLEAKLEDNDRYFYHTKIVNRILGGRRLYVIGRKGTGKTAISEHLLSIQEPSYLTKKLTFKNFPFNRLYELRDRGFTSPNQYITLWKYVIYSTICELMKNNPKVDLDSRDKLRRLYGDGLEDALPLAVEKWTGFDFNVDVLGASIKFGGNKESVTVASDDWTRRVEVLEKFIHSQIGSDKYLIMFDELDEDYKDIIEPEKHRQYTELMTSLFKAVQDVRSRFQGYKLFPVIFLRDDIYEILDDPDKTKWLDFKVDLDWDEEGIRSLLAFRLSRAIDRVSEPLPFKDVWHQAVTSSTVRYGNRKSKGMAPFNYITRSSLLRPRDYIRYLQVCAVRSIDAGAERISSNTIEKSDLAFSNYLRSEFEDEIHGVLPDVHRILDIFATLRKQTLRIDEFRVAYENALNDGILSTKDYQFVLRVLFHFSLIGNQPKQASAQIWRYKKKEARLNMQENIIIHRGMFASLQLL